MAGKWNLQFFADDPDILKETKETPEDKGSGEDSPTNKDKSTEQISHLEAKLENISKVLESIQQPKESEKPKGKEEKQDLESKIKELELKLQSAELRNYTEKELVKEKLSDFSESLLPLVMAGEEKKTSENIKVIKTIIDKTVERRIEEIKKGKSVPGNGDISKDILDKEVEAIFTKNSGTSLDDFFKK